MSIESLFEVERNALASLQKLVRERKAAEEVLAESHRTACEAAEKEIQKARKAIASARKRAEEELAESLANAAEECAERFDNAEGVEQAEYREAKRLLDQQANAADAKLKNEYRERLWTIDSMAEAMQKEADTIKARLIREAEKGGQSLAKLWARAEAVLGEFGVSRGSVEYPRDRLPAPTATADHEGMLQKALEESGRAVESLERSPLTKYTGVLGTMGLVLLLGAIAFGIGWAAEMTVPVAIGFAAFGALAGGLLVRQLLAILARRQVKDRGVAFGIFAAEAERSRAALAAYALSNYESMQAELTKRHAGDLQKVELAYRPKVAAHTKQTASANRKLETQHAEAMKRIAEERTALEHEIRGRGHRTGAEIAARFDGELSEAESRYSTKLQLAGKERDRAWAAMAAAWTEGHEQVRSAGEELVREGRERFPEWGRLLGPKAPVANTVPAGIRFGEYAVDRTKLPGGTPLDHRLTPGAEVAPVLPAYLPFPDRSAVILKARDQGRADVVAAMKSMMLRFLTGLPPGKVRFTIIDPVGLGENFAAFMHLADYDEQLVSSRIWVEAGDIDRRLADLSEHMQNVIQKYLRNQYASIEEYNRAAGEVAEPYRVLVVANFPTNFTPEAARRLVSIAGSGPACGVCTLVGIDTNVPMPRDFNVADLEQVAFNLQCGDGTFTPMHQEFKPFPLAVDKPPGPADVAAIVKRIGEASTKAARVEVPFGFIAPNAADVWTFSTREGFSVPIGRAGATRRQVFALGKGTAQHALVAGKTGSGKSTLIHALITNLAMMYSPDEAELYLIDFKKGVEFQMYAANRLPHARVIAIESEREFGLSVLQRLDGILKERGERFRAAGCNDVAGYRDARPDERLPRILFVVDEFQEFFTEDDKLAQEAGLLLDRLVRQGRAFGVHVLLGSQTLGGAYALPRSTIDQMAVRIALQCSEADAQLILAKENTAARLLTRPGEAIYNDANGMVEGNDPFQVVWLSEDHREEVLKQLHERDAGRMPPPLVFEGTATAEFAGNVEFIRMLSTPVETGLPTVWLGDPIAIKEPTRTMFRTYSGANLLLLGQSEEAALATLTSAFVALAARLRPTSSGILTILDGTPDDSEYADHLRRVSFAVGLTTASKTRAELPAAIHELAVEVDRRLKDASAGRSPRFLIIHGLQRLRELRKAEDDFGFGRRGEKALSPADEFATILREGPAVGVHVVAWCDSIANLARAVDRSGMREFSMRVLFQMNPNDSAQLIDTPAASKLGRNRALYVEEGLERPEKFRPYGLCRMDWLRKVGETLALEERNEALPSPEPISEGDALPVA
jgi:hypothetical protein